MFDEVLKRGSLIVDGLSAYKSPAFVYIVPNGELRGGAWVVLDPSINNNGQMEMYADETARAGVLEPEGIAEIKLRKDKIVAMMARLDTTYRELKAKSSDASLGAEGAAEAKAQLAEREKVLFPLYSQIAIQFADLHDRPNRMLAKGAIRKSLVWADSRKYFFGRLRRRLAEEAVLKELAKADASLPREERIARMEATIEGTDLSDDLAVAAALEKGKAAISQIVKKAQGERFEAEVEEMLEKDQAAVVSGLVKKLGLSAEQVGQLQALLKQ